MWSQKNVTVTVDAKKPTSWSATGKEQQSAAVPQVILKGLSLLILWWLNIPVFFPIVCHDPVMILSINHDPLAGEVPKCSDHWCFPGPLPKKITKSCQIQRHTWSTPSFLVAWTLHSCCSSSSPGYKQQNLGSIPGEILPYFLSQSLTVTAEVITVVTSDMSVIVMAVADLSWCIKPAVQAATSKENMYGYRSKVCIHVIAAYGYVDV